MTESQEKAERLTVDASTTVNTTLDREEVNIKFALHEYFKYSKFSRFNVVDQSGQAMSLQIRIYISRET